MTYSEAALPTGQWEQYVMSDESLQGHFVSNGAMYFLCPGTDTLLITLIE